MKSDGSVGRKSTNREHVAQWQESFANSGLVWYAFVVSSFCDQNEAENQSEINKMLKQEINCRCPLSVTFRKSGIRVTSAVSQITQNRYESILASPLKASNYQVLFQ